MTVQLKTDRLTLKTLTKASKEKVRLYYAENEDFFAPWQGKYDATFLQSSSIEYMLERQTQDFENGSLLKFWFFQKSDTQCKTIIGECTFSNIRRANAMNCRLGYNIHHKYKQQGFMIEALDEAIRFVFRGMQMHRIESHVMPKNEASIKVLNKAGFIFEGISYEYLRVNGVWEDHYCYSLLNK
ncbi:MAG: GNAT family N-acetyltransferase [Candidatus Kapabacteria bacterium]|nr:GNAT family N-acetyltransferase [Candidatus Kapabacteria bacterium]